MPPRARPPRPAHLSTAAFALVLGLAACGGEPESARPAPATPVAEPAPRAEALPPIVLISIDTLRADRLPAYGYGGVETPAIDALRRDGVLCRQAWSHVPLTMPSHASIFTGLLPPAHGVRDNIGYRFDAGEGVATLPRLLKQRGYATGAAVSAFVLRGAAGFADGFDLYEDSIERRERAGAGGLQRSGKETLASILPWLGERGEAPFFLFFHLFEPHTPYAPPEPFAGRYASPYDGEVAAADEIVGELLATLRRLGVYERSAIVLLSDHGEGLGDHGEDEHGVLLYRESLEVPLILKLPGGAHAGRELAAPAQLVDVLPTLAELAGAAPPPGLPGRSLLAMLEEAEPPPRQIYAETFFPRLHFGWSELTALMEGRYQLIDGPDPELYDLAADPRQQHNRVREERQVAGRLRRDLAGFAHPLEMPVEVGAEERRQLAALGYVGSVGGEAEGPLPDPKSRLGTVADLKRGLAHYSAGELEQAVAAYRRAVAQNPRSLDAWEYLGRSLHGLGRPAEAFEAYQQAIELAGGRAGHLAIASALLLLNAGLVDDALAYLRLQIPRAPEERALRLLEARALLLAGRAGEALERAEALVREAPEDADAVYLRGAVHIGRRDLAAAEADLRRALELAPDHTAAMSDLAALRKHRGDLEEARRLLERVLELNPADAAARRNLEQLGAR